MRQNVQSNNTLKMRNGQPTASDEGFALAICKHNIQLELKFQDLH